MQDIFIVPGSIRENILLDRELSEAEIHGVRESLAIGKPGATPSTGTRHNDGEGAMDLSSGSETTAGVCESSGAGP